MILSKWSVIRVMLLALALWVSRNFDISFNVMFADAAPPNLPWIRIG